MTDDLNAVEAEARMLLLDSLATMKDRGWTKGQLISPSGKVCVLGAIRSSSKSGMVRAAAERLFATGLDRPIEMWNDSHERVETEVHDRFRTIARQGM